MTVPFTGLLPTVMPRPVDRLPVILSASATLAIIKNPIAVAEIIEVFNIILFMCLQD
jgi:hypothetical protein